jgi:hypothetical protein
MNQTHVLDGHTGVEHSLPVPRIYKDTVELFARSSSGYTPTLVVGYGGLSGEYYWYQHTNVAGGMVLLGAHGQLQGLGAHWELWMLEQGGLTPMEALRAATIDGARYLGLDGELGSIEQGKLADLIVLDRNPLENIRHSESISMVMLNGRLYEAATLDEIGNHPRPRRPFWFEGPDQGTR